MEDSQDFSYIIVGIRYNKKEVNKCYGAVFCVKSW